MEHWADYFVFALFLLISMSIGLFFSLTGGKQKTNEEFLMADRSLKVLPTTISLVASFQSAIMIIGTTAEVYVGGTNAWLMGQITFTITLLIVAWIFVPWFYPMKLTSIYKIFEMRFGDRAVRMFAAILGILGQVMYMGTATLAPSIALETATGFPANVSIPIMAIVSVIYTCLGGMKAVIWTDVFQAGIMVVGMLTILIKGLVVVGGFGEAFNALGEENRLRLITWSPDPTVRHTLWGFLIGSGTLWISVYGTKQASVQRLCALPTIKQAKWTVLLNLPALYIMYSIAQLTGVVVVAYYVKSGCDPLVSGTISRTNELLPLFVRDVFKSAPGFGGLFMATLYSGALSSVSSCLSGAAANTWDDILQWYLGKLPENRKVWINKAVVIMYGVLAVGFSFMVNEMPGPIMQVSLGVGGALSAPLMALFLISCIRHLSWCNSKGTLFGAIIGLLFMIWITIGGVFVKQPNQVLPPLTSYNCTTMDFYHSNVNTTEPHSLTGVDRLYGVSYIWKPFFGLLVSMVAMMILSAIFNYFGVKREKHDIPQEVYLRLYRRRQGFEREKDFDNDLEVVEKLSLHTPI